MTPVGPLDPHPPLGRIEVTGENEAPAETFRLGAVTRRVDEGVERLVGHRGRVEQEWAELDLVDRPLAIGGEAVVALVAHPEDPAGDQHHFRGCGPGHAPESAQRRRRSRVHTAARAAAGWGSVLLHVAEPTG